MGGRGGAEAGHDGDARARGRFLAPSGRLRRRDLTATAEAATGGDGSRPDRPIRTPANRWRLARPILLPSPAHREWGTRGWG